MHWMHSKSARRHIKLAINAVGAVTTGAVAIIVASTKFLEGAWIVLLLVPLLAFNFWAIHRHYARARHELASVPKRHAVGKQRVIVPVNDLDRGKRRCGRVRAEHHHGEQDHGGARPRRRR